MQRKPVQGGITADQVRQEPAISSSLESIYQLNERCVSLIAQGAHEATAGQPPLIRCLKSSLVSLTPQERSRAARRSFLLLNLEFSNPKAWAGFIAHPARSTAGPDRYVWFPALGARALARATLTVLWHSLRNDPHAIYRFGLAPSVVELIRPLTLGHLEQIGERQFRWLKPRWADSPGIWQELLSTSGQYRVARELNARTLQLMMGAVLTH